jgi:hypothetical protein
MPKKTTNVEREVDDDTLVDAGDGDTEVTDPDAMYCKVTGDRLKNGRCPNRDCPLYNKPQG